MKKDLRSPRVLVTGGGGYVGAVLVPQLLERGHAVTVLDLFIFGEDVLDSVRNHPDLKLVKGDIRDRDLLKQSLAGHDAVIHLACISNDPSFELDPALSRTINFDAFEPLVDISRDSGVRRFIYASSSSVYGVSNAPEVTEDHPLVPITDYNKYKGLCEPILIERQSPDFTTVVIRPATVCGYSPRQRLDLTVNILTAHAVNRGKITVFGGTQKRPNLNIADMTALYRMLLDAPDEKIAGKTFNAGYQNRTVNDIAGIVKNTVEAEMPERAPVEIETTSSDDPRSYHINSDRIRRELGFEPNHSIEDAVRELVRAFREDRIPRAMDEECYYNVRLLRRLHQSGGIR